MATKNVNQLTAELESLNNKELHNRCLEYGLNVPVADSSRDVIIRKLLKCMGALPVTSPKASKKQQNKINKQQSNEQIQTINVTVLVDDDDDDENVKRPQGKTQKSKSPSRTQSPQTRSHRETEVANNNKNKTPPQTTSKVTPILKSATDHSEKHKKTVRIVPMEVDLGENNVDKFHCEVRRSGGRFDDSNYAGARVVETTTSIDDMANANFSSFASNRPHYDSPPSVRSSTTTIDDDADGYEPSVSDYSYNSTQSTGWDNAHLSRPHIDHEPVVSPLSKSLFDEINANNSRPRHVTTTTAIDVIDDEDDISREASNFRHLGFRGLPHGTAALNDKHSPLFSSLSKTSVSTTSYNDECTPETTITGGNFIGSPVIVAPAQAIFKQPLPPTKSLKLNKQHHYGPDDAKRLYPRLPTELYEPLTPPTTPSTSEQTDRSSRASSLAKSGTLTTSYTQELTPTREIILDDVEGEHERDETGYVGKGSGYDRSTYLSGMLHESPRVQPYCRLPFEPQVQPTYRQSLGTQTPPDPISDDDELDSDLENEEEQESAYIENDADASSEEYEVESSTMGRSFSSHNPTSSYGGTQIYERVPQRRSASNRKRYSEQPRSSMSRRSINENDVDASFRQLVETVDRKYHVKELIAMLGIFVLAVVIYVFFIGESNAA